MSANPYTRGEIDAAEKAWQTAINGSDLDWFEETGHCGGCGDDTCHPGQPCGDVRGYDHGVCDLCPTRVATGEIRAVRAP